MKAEAQELSKEEYEATFSPPMLDVTSDAEEIVDLWAYADPVLQNLYPHAGDWEWHVKHIYESKDGIYQHLNVPVPRDNTYLSIVVIKPERRILGHYILDLAALYPDWSE